MRPGTGSLAEQMTPQPDDSVEMELNLLQRLKELLSPLETQIDEASLLTTDSVVFIDGEPVGCWNFKRNKSGEMEARDIVQQLGGRYSLEIRHVPNRNSILNRQNLFLHRAAFEVQYNEAEDQVEVSSIPLTPEEAEYELQQEFLVPVDTVEKTSGGTTCKVGDRVIGVLNPSRNSDAYRRSIREVLKYVPHVVFENLPPQNILLGTRARNTETALQEVHFFNGMSPDEAVDVAPEKAPALFRGLLDQVNIPASFLTNLVYLDGDKPAGYIPREQKRQRTHRHRLLQKLLPLLPLVRVENVLPGEEIFGFTNTQNEAVTITFEHGAQRKVEIFTPPTEWPTLERVHTDAEEVSGSPVREDHQKTEPNTASLPEVFSEEPTSEGEFAYARVKGQAQENTFPEVEGREMSMLQQLSLEVGRALTHEEMWDDHDFVSRFSQYYELFPDFLIHRLGGSYIFELHQKGIIPHLPKRVLSIRSGIFGETFAQHVDLASQYQSAGMTPPEVVSIDRSDAVMAVGLYRAEEQQGVDFIEYINPRRGEAFDVPAAEGMDTEPPFDLVECVNAFSLLPKNEDPEAWDKFYDFLDGAIKYADQPGALVRLATKGEIPSDVYDYFLLSGYRVLTPERSVLSLPSSEKKMIIEKRLAVLGEEVTPESIRREEQRLQRQLLDNGFFVALKVPEYVPPPGDKKIEKVISWSVYYSDNTGRSRVKQEMPLQLFEDVSGELHLKESRDTLRLSSGARIRLDKYVERLQRGVDKSNIVLTEEEYAALWVCD